MKLIEQFIATSCLKERPFGKDLKTDRTPVGSTMGCSFRIISGIRTLL